MVFLAGALLWDKGLRRAPEQSAFPGRRDPPGDAGHRPACSIEGRRQKKRGCQSRLPRLTGFRRHRSAVADAPQIYEISSEPQSGGDRRRYGDKMAAFLHQEGCTPRGSSGRRVAQAGAAAVLASFPSGQHGRSGQKSHLRPAGTFGRPQATGHRQRATGNSKSN